MPPKPPLLVSLLSSALLMLTVPVAVVGLAIFSGQVVERFQEGGAFMYVLLASGMGLSLLAAGLVFIASRGRGWASAGPAVLSSVVVVAGVLATRLAVSRSLDAVSHAMPDDRGTIMHAATSEAWSLLVFALLLGAAMMSMAGFAFALEFMARLMGDDVDTRRFNLGLTLAYGALSAWLVGVAGQEVAWAHAHQAMAHASPLDRTVLIISALTDRHQGAVLGWGVLALAVALIAGCAVMLRSSTVAVGSLVTLLVVPMVVLASHAATTTPDAVQAAFRMSGSPEGLVNLESAPSDSTGRVTLEASTEFDLAPSLGLPLLGVNVTTDATSESMNALFQAVVANHISEVELRGTNTMTGPEGLTLPPEFEGALVMTTGARVQVRDEATFCDPRCDFVTIDSQSLTRDGQKWTFESLYADWPRDLKNVSAVRAQALKPVDLMRAAVTAAKHETQLVVVVPAPR